MEPKESEIAYLRRREEEAAKLLEIWFNAGSILVGAPTTETLDWLAKMAPRPEGDHNRV
jgi:hypothetical protein